MTPGFTLPFIPERTEQPRKTGLTMVMDKGLSIRQAENMLSTSGKYIDLLKLGFGTAYVTDKIDQKIKIYHETGLKVYFGGTFFEAFLVRDRYEDYCRLVDKFKMDTVEISDGSLMLPHDEKCSIIHKLAKNYTVLSEVGSKEEGIIIHPKKWISLMNKELKAGSWKVIAEARESGTVGIFHKSGDVHKVLISRIRSGVNADDIIWEAPMKKQQVWFIDKFGANVNIGNIAPDDVIPLETLRLGLRGDTFFRFLPDPIIKKYKP